MEMYKIVLKSDTAFFRNDVTCTSYQETFDCPPLSAIYGLIAAAYGEYKYDFDIGYIFSSNYITTDFELILRKDSSKKEIYQKYIFDDRFDRNDILRGCNGTIPIKRNILVDCSLILYISKEEVAKSFEQPYYALLLGRTEDLATVVEKPRKVKLVDVKIGNKIGHTIIPLKEAQSLPGRISKMNIKITETYPRIVQKAGIYNILNEEWPLREANDSIKFDPVLNEAVYIHKGIYDV